MNKILFLLALIGSTYFFSNPLQGQSTNSRSSVNIGFSISQFQNDYGLGLHIISPYFANNTMALKFGATLQWFEYQDEQEMTWDAYGNFQIGLRTRQTIIDNKIFVYGEGGCILLLPNKSFSTQKNKIGGYGLFGFEFKTPYSTAYFIELGGAGIGAKADKIEGEPIYANGFLTNVGIRFSF